MSRFILNAAAYYIPDEKLQRLSAKLTCKFNDIMVDEDAIQDLVETIAHYITEKTGYNASVRRMEIESWKSYKIFVTISENNRPFITDFTLSKIDNTVYDKGDVSKMLNDIYWYNDK